MKETNWLQSLNMWVRTVLSRTLIIRQHVDSTRPAKLDIDFELGEPLARESLLPFLKILKQWAYVNGYHIRRFKYSADHRILRCRGFLIDPRSLYRDRNPFDDGDRLYITYQERIQKEEKRGDHRGR